MPRCGRMSLRRRGNIDELDVIVSLSINVYKEVDKSSDYTNIAKSAA